MRSTIMRSTTILTAVVAVGVALGLGAPTALAGAIVPFAPGPTIFPMPGLGVPPPGLVPGKEYSTDVDSDAFGVADPGQVVSWDGRVGGVADSFDYTGTGGLPTSLLDENLQLDALANSGDALYSSVIIDASALLFSTDGDGSIYAEKIAAAGGGGGIWAPPPLINAAHPPTDIDGLEVWGGDGPGADDANRFSIKGDPTGVAVWATAGGPPGPAASLYTDAELAAAILPLAAALISLSELENMLDLDAMMTFLKDDILFSIDPIMNATGAVVFDGGEIFVYDRSLASVSFLTHGGHVWDTAFSVMGTFGTATENINALESVAIPVPATLALFGVGLAGLGVARRRQAAA